MSARFRQRTGCGALICQLIFWLPVHGGATAAYQYRHLLVRKSVLCPIKKTLYSSEFASIHAFEFFRAQPQESLAMHFGNMERAPSVSRAPSERLIFTYKYITLTYKKNVQESKVANRQCRRKLKFSLSVDF